MELTVQIPDELASRMSASGADLSRRALEALALEDSRAVVSPSLNCGGCSVMEPGIGSTGS